MLSQFSLLDLLLSSIKEDIQPFVASCKEAIYLFNQICLLDLLLASIKECIKHCLASYQETIYLASNFCLLYLLLVSIKEDIQQFVASCQEEIYLFSQFSLLDLLLASEPGSCVRGEYATLCMYVCPVRFGDYHRVYSVDSPMPGLMTFSTVE